ncbi:transketolase [Thauera sp. CAU 1555]|uniref:Transketolase n=1 Tax=Thauera sedimentorum TaxID=2767595 RepID=A0ABR9BEL2_9RHOO|nr:transketolase [Thauera sedimentorum]MBC9073879.1 transketolase [Thauera sedimentorum]MBD8504798.1 transketolase [Thauera sedimentorum]
MNMRFDSAALDTLCANALRFLAIDAVEQAKSGHPGMPMGMAEIAVALWTRHLRHDPADPAWADRDRFVLSNGHGSMLLYGLLHLTGYDLPVDELKRFRQLHSKTPGHPEHGLTPGVETTTGPLGQGLANAVGMALAEKLLAREFNRPGHDIVDHRTWVFMGDGCLMEGVSHEAASFAGVQRLSKLIALWDDNRISIDGQVDGWFADDTPARFRAYGWNVIESVDGHSVAAVDRAIREAVANAENDVGPTLICCRTTIGRGSPARAGTADVHGAPLGAEEIAATRAALGWPHAPFEIPAEVRTAFDTRAAGAERRAAWQARFETYRAAWPEAAAEFERRMAGQLPVGFPVLAQAILRGVNKDTATVASRKASQQAIARLARALPELLGGSADLTHSNLTDWPGCGAVRADAGGRHINWGVREFGMSAALNGIALHGGFLPFGATFLVFSDYARNAIRMSALLAQRVVYVMTHDSIGLGEDGPTHQPVEHLPSLRLIPGLDVWRPCDAVETQAAWSAAVQHRGPSLLALSRQNLPHQARDAEQLEAIARGGYVLAEAAGGKPALLLIATGSEVALAMAARERLQADGIPTRVVSMPCTAAFDRQDADWRAAVLPAGVPRVAVEAAQPDGWWKYLADAPRAAVVGIERFGESAPAADLAAFFGFTAERVADAARRLV